MLLLCRTGKKDEYGPSNDHPAWGKNINFPLAAKASDSDVLFLLRNIVWPTIDQFKLDISFYCLGNTVS